MIIPRDYVEFLFLDLTFVLEVIWIVWYCVLSLHKFNPFGFNFPQRPHLPALRKNLNSLVNCWLNSILKRSPLVVVIALLGQILSSP